VEEETTIASHRVFDSSGVLISETSSVITVLIGFTGCPLAESTGLQNNLNRWYDAEAGRWPSDDPIGFGGQDRVECKMGENLNIKSKQSSQGRFASLLRIWRQLASRIAEERVATETLSILRLRSHLRFQGMQATMRRSTRNVP
jgi:RHS repeat-associated protein